MSGLSLDAGALIALERGDRRVTHLIEEAVRRGLDVRMVAGVLAQTWRGGPRQARVARLLAAAEVEITPLDHLSAQAVGELIALSGHSDVVDVHVVLDARDRGHRVVTSDPEDLLRVDPQLPLIRI